MAERPLGVTIISILGFIGAVLLFLSGIIFMTLGAILVGFLGPLGALGTAAGIIVLIMGVLQFVVSYGLWKMRKWGLYIELILLIIGIVSSIVIMSYSGDLTQIVSVIVSLIILYYLYTKRSLFS